MNVQAGVDPPSKDLVGMHLGPAGFRIVKISPCETANRPDTGGAKQADRFVKRLECWIDSAHRPAVWQLTLLDYQPGRP